MVHPIRQSEAEPVTRPGGRVAAGGRVPASGRVPAGGRAGQPGVQLTGRGAVTGMCALFFLSLLISAGLGWAWLAGVAFVVGSGAAARYTQRRDLLTVAVTPPLLFLCALVLARILTAGSHVLVSAAAGSLLTLAGVAPWLFAGVALNLVVGVTRGLPGCVRDLRRDLREGAVRAAGHGPGP